MQRDINVGDEVLLIPNKTSVGYVPGLEKWRECRLIVSKILGDTRDGGEYYELERCVSELGVPYGILREWMFKVK